MLRELMVLEQQTIFKGSAESTYNQLSWKTTSEIDNDFFEIERKLEGSEVFEAIGRVSGNGTTFETQSYEFKDRDVDAGLYLYRLRQVDFGGAFEYSKVITVERKTNESVDIFPNPTVDYLRIDFGQEVEGNAKLHIVNSSGQLVLSIPVSNENTELKVDVSNLTSGQYFIDFRSQKLTFKKSFIKVK